MTQPDRAVSHRCIGVPGAGTESASMSLVDGVRVPTAGWVHVEFCCASTPGECSDVCEEARFRSIPVVERYVASLYKGFNALEHARTTSERGFAVFAELCIGLIFGSLAGLMSSVMVAIRGNEVEISRHLRQLKLWLSQKQLSDDTQERVMQYFHSR